MRWDWLENGDDWATEASVYGNPNGDRFYAVWNQELPVDVDNDIYTDMDTEFRRIFYNLTGIDTTPTAEILYVSQTAADYDDDDLFFSGTGRDYDRMGDEGITDFLWTSSLDGTLSNGKSFTIPVSQLSTGIHTISFKVCDDEGNWSAEKTVTLFVAEELTQIHLPVVIK
jgi:hypothetical protein